MWLTLVICLDIFLAYIITNGIVWGLYLFLIHLCKVPSSAFTLPFLILEYFHIPPGFIDLVHYVPNLILIGIYFMYQLPYVPAFKSLPIWKYFRESYFTIKTVNYEPPSSQVIYAVSPHGCYGEAIHIGFVLNETFKSVVPVSTSLLFWIPIVREFAYLAGAIPANTFNISHALNAGQSIVMAPEGMRGVLHMNDHPLTVLRGIPGECEPRVGFIRCAITCPNKVKIIPVYVKGIDKLYTVYNLFPWLQKKLLKTYYYPWPMLNFGFWGSPWPKPAHLIYCFGKEISLERNGKKKDIMEIHEEYCQAIKELAI